MFVKVAVNVPVHKTFTYRVPEALRKDLATGTGVLVPFGGRRTTGYIIDIINDAPDEAAKDILSLSDPEPLFQASDLLFKAFL